MIDDICIYIAHGTLQSSAAGVTKDLVSKAQELKHGKAPDDQPAVTVELDTGLVIMSVCICLMFSIAIS